MYLSVQQINSQGEMSFLILFDVSINRHQYDSWDFFSTTALVSAHRCCSLADMTELSDFSRAKYIINKENVCTHWHGWMDGRVLHPIDVKGPSATGYDYICSPSLIRFFCFGISPKACNFEDIACHPIL